MKENTYRAYMAFILTVFLGGILFIGYQFMNLHSQQVQKGRFIQYDDSKNYTHVNFSNSDKLIDTQTGMVCYYQNGKIYKARTLQEYKP